MLRRLSLTLLLLATALPAVADWSHVPGPTIGPARVYGFYSAGCLAGAEVLPPLGRGYQVMRLSRDRYYGHPQLIALIRHLGDYAADRGVRLLIGDLAQARGGPMPYGHRSHQTGLDADIWFTLLPQNAQLPQTEVEQRPMRSVVDRLSGRLVSERWESLFTDLLRHTALIPEVERIFVNPVIKQALCHSLGDQDWLGKLRPWWGHDSHFHVRLACPTDSPACEPQTPPAPGSGCDEDLASWIEEQRQPPVATGTPAPRPVRQLPEICRQVRISP